MSQNYIFGYGSLIQQESRMRAAPKARYALPVVVDGIARGWWARTGSIGFTTTYLGAVADDGAQCNGVLYAVSEEELERTHERERGYTPTRIDPDKIHRLDGGSELPDATVWIYLNDFSPSNPLEKNLPTAELPIVQSYVDICVDGCLEIEAAFPTAGGFARQFLETTREWSTYWVNDRIYPRRPFIHVPNASTIDGLLKASLPEYFATIQLEPVSY